MDEQKHIPRSLHGAMLLQFAIGGAVMPFVTILLRDRGLGIDVISGIFAASSATLLFFPFLWGMLADRYVPMNRLFTGLNIVALAALGMLVVSRGYWGLLFAVIAFNACFTPLLMLINALCFHHLTRPQEQFGRLRAWGSLGWIVPSVPIYFWLISPRHHGLEFVVYLAMGLTAAMIVMTFFLPHTPPGARRAIGFSPAALGYWPAMRQLVRDPNYLVILISFFLISGSFSLYVYYSPPFLEDQGIDRAWVGPIQSLGVVGEIFLFQKLWMFIRRWGYTACILVGCSALCLRHLLFVFFDQAWVLTASYLLAGVVIVFYHITVSILVNAIAAREVRATAQTLIVLCGHGLGPMVANAAAGWISEGTDGNLRAVFLLAAVLAGLAGILVAVRGKRLEKRAEAAAGE